MCGAMHAYVSVYIYIALTSIIMLYFLSKVDFHKQVIFLFTPSSIISSNASILMSLFEFQRQNRQRDEVVVVY